jgi:hypothetical protein
MKKQMEWMETCGWSKLEKRGLENEALNEFHITCEKKIRDLHSRGNQRDESQRRTKTSSKTIFL